MPRNNIEIVKKPKGEMRYDCSWEDDVKMEHIGDRVRAIRRRRALTQAELAEAAELSTDAVVKLENGKHEPRPKTVRKLADALDVPVETLTVGEG